MKRFIIALVFTFWAFSSVQNPTSAYYANFDELPAGTSVGNIVFDGVHFSGSDWLVRDMSATGLYPVTLSKNAIRGCSSTLTITFDQPQRLIGFNFEFNTAYTDAYAMTLVATSKGALVESASYRGLLGETWRYPEGYALLATDDSFDVVTISHNAVGYCLYIDNLSTATRSGSRLGQVYVAVPGSLLYDQAGGSAVRDSAGQEMRIPNQSAPDPWYDTYNVLGQTVLDGQVWVQIFDGDLTTYPWIPLGPNTWFYLYGA